jgi:hypothetical protein
MDKSKQDEAMRYVDLYTTIVEKTLAYEQAC